MRSYLIFLLIVCLYLVTPSESCYSKSTSKSESSSYSSASSSSGQGDPNLFNRGSFDQGSNTGFHGVSVGTSCDSNGNCKKYEQTW